VSRSYPVRLSFDPDPQHINCDQILSEFLFRISQLCDFFHCPFINVPELMPGSKLSTLSFIIYDTVYSFDPDQISYFGPIIAMFLYRFSQLCVFFRYSFTSVDAGFQIPDPSLTTLSIRSKGNERSNVVPFVAVFLYRFNQLCVFFRCPSTLVMCGRQIDGGVQTLEPFVTTLYLRAL
jgi:hypothetical protein